MPRQHLAVTSAHHGECPAGSRGGHGGARFSLLPLQVLCRCENSILRECFLVAELESRRRPPTVSGKYCADWGGDESHPGVLPIGYQCFSSHSLPFLEAT